MKNIPFTYSMFISIIMLITLQCYPQSSIVLNFSGINNSEPVNLDQIWIKNLTGQCDTMLPAGSTSVVLETTGIQDYFFSNEKISGEIYPNPVLEKAEIRMYNPSEGEMKIEMIDPAGRSGTVFKNHLTKGLHRFIIYPGNQGLYLFHFSCGTSSGTVRLVSSVISQQPLQFKYLSFEGKANDHGGIKSARRFTFSIGDQLLLVGYSGTQESGVILSPVSRSNIEFQFGYGFPCPGKESFSFHGREYNTVQILSQCWMKENLNDGTLIGNGQDMSDNDILEKYCYDNDEGKCSVYGALYQWGEIMQYVTTEGVQGICPNGWHVPTDEEWKVLEGAADSQYGIGDPVWDEYICRGFDSGMNLKSSLLWEENGEGTDKYGFSVIPAGRLNDINLFYHIGYFAFIWSSTENDEGWAWYRHFNYDTDMSCRTSETTDYAFSVRCLKDY